MAKSRGYRLTHPNSKLFKILKTLEISFNKFANLPNVFEQTCDYFLQISSAIKFPCSEHQTIC